MFGQYTLNDPRLRATHYPIHSSKPDSIRVANASTNYCPIADLNRKILTRYALIALADHDMLSGRMIGKSEFADPAAPGPEKEYTFQIYGDDIDYRFGKRVMFADSKDVSKLVQIMEKAVGEENMHVLKRYINSHELDVVNKTGMEFLKKWRRGEGWPFEAN